MLIVGIGASTGGLEALAPFVSNLSKQDDISYIVVQHQNPDSSVAVFEKLTDATSLTVEKVIDGATPRPGVIHIAPDDCDIQLSEGCFRLTPASASQYVPCIDLFFNSLAQQPLLAIGIILSGNGQNGVYGVQALRQAGGVTIAQKPNTALFPEMPRAAIHIGEADLTLSPAEAAKLLPRIANRLKSISLSSVNKEYINSIIDDVFTTTGLDFVNYKESTISRQIHRRMAILQIPDIKHYCQHIGENPQENFQLANTFLICVTSFFRNKHCFDALRLALQEVISNKSPGDDIRIWSPGCATGEEVYSIAMLLAEELGPSFSRYRIQIYGTDINDKAIQVARKGVYNQILLEQLPVNLRDKYFTRHQTEYSVCKLLRERVIFSRQDLIKDPPFIRLDLISCRNLLIYLNQILQEKVLSIFHYSLRNNGVLFLGNAESLWSLNDAFTELDRNSKLFIKNNSRVIRPELTTTRSSQLNTAPAELYSAETEQSYKALGLSKLVEKFSPPSILANREGHILEFFNHCDEFIKIPKGKADFNLFSIIDPVFKTELKAHCYHALNNKSEVSSHLVDLPSSLVYGSCRVYITPVSHPDQHEKLLLISFQFIEKGVNPVSENTDHEGGRDIKHDLMATRETLQTVTEALGFSENQLQMLTEEAQASNEELQSSNEELETSNEELQSINEELTLVNDELSDKTNELSLANDDLSNILDSLQKAVLVVDQHLTITRYNKTSKAFLKVFKMDEPYSLTTLDTVFNNEQLSYHTQEVINSKKKYQKRLALKDSYYQLNIYPYVSANDSHATGAVLSLLDVTERYQSEQQVRLSAKVFDAANEAIIITDQHNSIVSINPAFTQITGYEKEEVIGKDPSIMRSGRHDKLFYHDMWQEINQQGIWQGEIWNRRKNGESFPEWLSISTIKDEKDEVSKHIGVFSDISESYKSQQIILKQANYDALTGLPNRNLFYDHLQQAMKNARRTGNLLSVMFIDLDGFKEINDALGHSLGDMVLQQTAERISQIFREVDTFARFGGDEFTVLLTDLKSETDAMPIAEKILQVIKTPIQINQTELHITASIGVSLFPNDGDDIETLLKNADSAMYTVKAEGRNGYRFFTPEMHERAKEQHRIANDIKNAVNYNKFEVYYQPVYDFKSQCIVGAEALVRWNHPIRGFIPPDKFIPIAERLGMISSIGDFVLEQACQFMAEINRNRKQPLSIAINFSPGQFLPDDCADHWLKIIEDSGMDSSMVVMEITESLLMSHQNSYLKQLEKLRAHGIKIALDDFGTGYSSLSYLKRLPFDILKIDKSFIRDILVDDSDASLVESILSIAEIFSLEVIAEGVEQKGQADFLIERRCGYSQGYHYSAPVPEDKFMNLLEQYKHISS